MDNMNQIDFPDLTILGTPPEAFIKAMRVASTNLHQFFRPIFGENSKTSCVLSSLTLRDFLFQAGFRDVEVRPVKTIMKAVRGGEELNSVGIGYSHGGKADIGRWTGHMVVCSPSLNYVIDTTLFQAKRDAWPFLPGMMAVPIHNQQTIQEIFGLKTITGFKITVPEDDYSFEIIWLDDPTNTKWKEAPDTSKRRREPVVQKLTAALARAA